MARPNSRLSGRLAADLGSSTASAGSATPPIFCPCRPILPLPGLATLHVSGPLKLAQFDPAALMKALGADKPAIPGY